MSTQRRRGLGMGLSALLGEPAAPLVDGAAPPGFKVVPIELLCPSPFQPRRHFGAEELNALAQSLRTNGLLQPLVVRPARKLGEYEIVAGERRWRAAPLAGMHELPVVVRELSDREVLELALVENLQRQDLNALEEARAYQKLLDDFDYTQERLATAVGRSRPHVTNTIRLLGLPEEVQALVLDGQLSAGHARALLGADDPVALAREVLQAKLSVRDTELRVASRARTVKARRSAEVPQADLADMQRRLAERLGLTVAIRPRKAGGMLLIRYSSPGQLDNLVEKLFSGG
jgi:ParB family chromosome partitioning protein